MNKIYIYTTETYRGKRWYKIGETEKNVDERIKDQDGTSNPEELEKIFEITTSMSDKKLRKILRSYGFKVVRDRREWMGNFENDDEVIFWTNKEFPNMKPTPESNIHLGSINHMLKTNF